MRYPIILFLFHTILFPAHELSSTQKLLLREKGGDNVDAWDDHDSKTIAALFLVDKDLNQSITTVRDSLIKKFPQFPLAQSTIVCNRFHWCAFKCCSSNPLVIDVFFGDQKHAQSYQIRSLWTSWRDSIHFESVTYADQRVFCLQPSKHSFEYFLISPENKSILSVVSNQNYAMNSYLDHYGMSSAYFTKAISSLARTVLKKIDNNSFFVNKYRCKKEDSVEYERFSIDFHNAQFQRICAIIPKLLSIEEKIAECICTPGCIDPQCALRYDAVADIFTNEAKIYSIPEQGYLEMAVDLRRSYTQTHIFSLIGNNASGTKRFFVNPFGHIVISDTVSKFSDNVGTIDILKPVNWEMFSLPEKAAWYAKQCFILGDILCYRQDDTYLHAVSTIKENQGFVIADTYQILFPADSTICDGFVHENACYVLLQEKKSNNTSLICCDIRSSLGHSGRETDFTYNTLEAARNHIYIHESKPSWPRFNQQRIHMPEALLKGLMHDIQNGYYGPIKELRKHNVTTLKIPVQTQQELAFNGDTLIAFQPNNIIDRLWYATQLSIAHLPNNLRREAPYVLGGIGSIVFAWVRLILKGLDTDTKILNTLPLFPTFFLGCGLLYHVGANDVARSGRRLNAFNKIVPYLFISLVGRLNFNSLKSQLLYAAMPIWFHLYDRIGMFIKPPTVQLPFNTLYTAWPARMRRAAGDRWNNSNTIFAAMMKYLLDT